MSVVIVTYDSAGAVAESLPALLRELAPGDELIVVDNASGDGTAERVRELAPAARLLAHAVRSAARAQDVLRPGDPSRTTI